MTINRDDLSEALTAGVIDTQTAERLQAFLDGRQGNVQAPTFNMVHLLWYAGALIVMAAMGLFTNTAFNAMGGMALLITALVYATVFLIAGDRLWRRGLTIPGGLLITCAIAMVPMAIFGLQDMLDLWSYAQGKPDEYGKFFPYVHGSWLYMEIGTILAALVALRFWPFPFIVFVAATALWFMSMDIVVWLKGLPDDDFDLRRAVSLWFGIGMCALGWAIDLRRSRKGDFGFWLHLFGALAFWGGLTLTHSSSELAKAGYCAINVALVLFAVYLRRRIYAVVGAFGVAAYLGHMAFTLFKDAILFSFALSAIGLAVIGLGLLVHRNEARLEQWIQTRLPVVLRAVRP